MELFDNKFVHFMWDDSLEGKEGFFADYIDTLVERVNNNIRGTVGAYQVFGTCSYGVDSYPFSVNNTCGRYRFFYYDPNYSCKRAYMEGKVIQFRNNSSDSWIVVSSPSWIDRCEYRVKPESTETSEQRKLRVYKCSDDTLHVSPYCITTDFLFEGTEEECKQYIKEHYCNKCIHKSCEMKVDCQFCRGFKESVSKPDEPKKNRRMTNRELAKWLAEGNGQMRIDGTRFTSWSYPSTNKEDDDTSVKEGIYIRAWDSDEWMEPEVEE